MTKAWTGGRWPSRDIADGLRLVLGDKAEVTSPFPRQVVVKVRGRFIWLELIKRIERQSGVEIEIR